MRWIHLAVEAQAVAYTFAPLSPGRDIWCDLAAAARKLAREQLQ